jgi:hypothetical protein
MQASIWQTSYLAKKTAGLTAEEAAPDYDTRVIPLGLETRSFPL